MVAATTRWKDTTVKSLDQALTKLTAPVKDDDQGHNIAWRNWSQKKLFEQNQKIKLNGDEVEYNMIRFNFDQLTTEIGTVVQKEGFIIVYHDVTGISYIIDQNSIALKLLRKIMGYSGKNQIEKNVIELSNDFFTWLIYRVYERKSNIEAVPESKALSLDTIKGFKGATDDMQTKVSADGETVMNIISTLSFLLESRNLSQVKIDLVYTEHKNISLQLNQGTIKIFFEEYMGKFEDETEKDNKIAKLYLTTYLELVPYLTQEYFSDKENELWNSTVHKNFLNKVADNLGEKVKEKLQLIQLEDEDQEDKN